MSILRRFIVPAFVCGCLEMLLTPALAASPSPHMKRAPRVKLKWGSTKSSNLPKQVGNVTAQATIKGHTYLEIQLPKKTVSPQRHEPCFSQSPHGLAIVGTGTGVMFARIVGPFDRAIHFTFSVPDGRRGSLTVSPKSGVPVDPDLAIKFFGSWADSTEQESPYSTFEQHRALLMANTITGGNSWSQGALQRQVAMAAARRNSQRGTMQLYTGMASVDEALQADRGLRIPRGKPGAATIPMGSIKGVALAAHPWNELIAEATKTGKTTAIEPLAGRVPTDVLFAHFHNIGAALKLGEDLSSWLTPLAQALEQKPGDHRLGERYQTMLMLQSNLVTQKLGQLAVAGVALVADDPFLRDGAAVAVVLHARDAVGRDAIVAHLDALKAKALAVHPSAASSTYNVGNHQVRLTMAPQIPIEQHRVVIGKDLVVVANSRPLLERIIAVNDGKAPALSGSGDFRYMRTIYPYDTQAEDGFVFIGDAFVAKAVGPHTKIAQSRRMRARADLQAVGFASLMFATLEGHPAKSTAELVASGLVAKSEFAHANGEVISLDLARGASSAWGSLRHMRSLDKVGIDKVTPVEKAAYIEFRDTYQSYWSKFIDPIAVRIKRSPDGKQLDVDARMLPLIEMSEYSDIFEVVGRTVFTPPVLDNGVQWTLAVGQSSWLRALPRHIGATFDWLGDWVMMGAASHGGFWDYAAYHGEIAALSGARRARSWSDGLVDAPLYAGVHMRSPLAAQAVLNDLEGIARGVPSLTWRSVFTHKGIKAFAVAAADSKRKRNNHVPIIGEMAFTVYSAAVKDVFLMSLDAATLRWLIDHALAGNMASRVTSEAPRQAEFRIEATPRGWINKTLSATAESSARKALGRAYQDATTLLRGLGPKPAAGFDAAAMGFFGYVPQSAQGGRFLHHKDHGVTHTLYGPHQAPKYPRLPSSKGALSGLLSSLEELSLGLSFEGHGASRGLHTTLRWRRRQ